ncbi:MAG: hypothetical protein PHR64_00575 [Candidatus Shapirobacteria bacterium]|nr:hypothetical protein [Candidatus Shapirobacteria bacterium]MDD5073669.1 hypothetical protein [Candidatus Shapirobacteria bacterium]MDD5481431.1 hypothetical protein [Candidatus Shapirobacteria bacterium]
MTSLERSSPTHKLKNFFLAATLAVGVSSGSVLEVSGQENQPLSRSGEISLNTNFPTDAPPAPIIVDFPEQYSSGDFIGKLPPAPIVTSAGLRNEETVVSSQGILPETVSTGPFEALVKETKDAGLIVTDFSRPNFKTTDNSRPLGQQEIDSLWFAIEESYKQLIDSNTDLNLKEGSFSADRITMFPIFGESKISACFLVLSSSKSGEAILLKYVEGSGLEIVSGGGININFLDQEQTEGENTERRIIAPSLLEFKKKEGEEDDYAILLGDFAFFFSPTERITEAVDRGEKLSLLSDIETLNFGIAVLDDNENASYVLVVNIGEEAISGVSQEESIVSEDQEKAVDYSFEKETEIFEVKVAEGESLSSVFSFYGLESQNIEFASDPDKVMIRMSPDKHDLPYKKIIIPSITMSISPWEEEWNSASAGYGDLIAYFPHFPYTFFGHTLIESSNLGSFAGLRSVRFGDHFFLSRSWLGEDGDWLEAEVVDIIRVFSREEEAAALSESNSQLLSFVTCLVESGNPDARLIIMAKVKNYNTMEPGNSLDAYR